MQNIIRVIDLLCPATGWRGGMSRIIPSNSRQLCLVPSSLGHWLPENHPVRIFDELVEQNIDVSKFCGVIGEVGRPGYDPIISPPSSINILAA
jgi:hypothetical protein